MKHYRVCLIIGCLFLATTALHSQSSCVAPPANLISWWRAENNALDSVGTNNGAFHHAAVTYDGTTEVLYLDGVAVHSVPFTQQGYTANYHYQLGTGYTAGWAGTTGLWSPFKGVVDEASLYGRALTPGEIAAIFNAGSAGKCYGTITVGADLKHRYSFGESAGTRIVTDLVGGANGSLLYAS